jgi:hypothetical protein
MQDVILGAAIGLISSIITLLVTNFFQSRRDDKTRQWLLEDQKRERKWGIFKERAKDAEAYVDQMFEASQKYYNAVITALLAGKFDNHNLSAWNRSNEALWTATAKQVYIFYFNDKALTDHTNELFALFEKLREKGTEVLDNLQNPRYDKNAAKQYLVEVMSKIGHTKKHVLLRLDELASLN